MTPDEIFDAFSSDTFPSEAIAVCRADKDASSQILLNLVKDFVMTGGVDLDRGEAERAINAFFLAIHLLAEFKEKRVFPLLMRFLDDDQEWVEEVLGDAITHTLPDVLISTFDGNLNELHQLITNAAVDEYVRASAIETLAYLTNEGMIPRESTQQFLKECFDIFRNEKPNFVWIGWVECIAVLGMEPLVHLVEQAFRDGVIDPSIMDFSHFNNDLRRFISLQTTHPQLCTRRIPFNNVDDLSSWVTYSPDKEYLNEFLLPSTTGSMDLMSNLPIPLQSTPHTNPYRDIGRNDPCPCGSGKKFKKCCLE